VRISVGVTANDYMGTKIVRFAFTQHAPISEQLASPSIIALCEVHMSVGKLESNERAYETLEHKEWLYPTCTF
jgi:hypothetical protein